MKGKFYQPISLKSRSTATIREKPWNSESTHIYNWGTSIPLKWRIIKGDNYFQCIKGCEVDIPKPRSIPEARKMTANAIKPLKIEERPAEKKRSKKLRVVNLSISMPDLTANKKYAPQKLITVKKPLVKPNEDGLFVREIKEFLNRFDYNSKYLTSRKTRSGVSGIFITRKTKKLG